jgi:hypothetical protein
MIHGQQNIKIVHYVGHYTVSNVHVLVLFPRYPFNKKLRGPQPLFVRVDTKMFRMLISQCVPFRRHCNENRVINLFLANSSTFFRSPPVAQSAYFVLPLTVCSQNSRRVCTQRIVRSSAQRSCFVCARSRIQI